MVEGSIARRYARALLELGKEGDLVDRLGEDLTRFLRIARGGDLVGVLSNPVYTGAERKGVLEAVLPGQALHPTTQNFLRLVLDKNRFAALPDILREYRAMADVHAGRVRALVTSSAELTPAAREQVRAALAEATGKTIVLEMQVDPSLLGGLTARVGSRVYDASLRTRLERLQLSLLHPSATPA